MFAQVARTGKATSLSILTMGLAATDQLMFNVGDAISDEQEDKTTNILMLRGSRGYLRMGLNFWTCINIFQRDQDEGTLAWAYGDPYLTGAVSLLRGF
jgi:hypothetical protein